MNLADWTGIVTLVLLVVFWITVVLLVIHLDRLNKEDK